MAFYDQAGFEPERSIGYLIRLIAQATQARTEPVLAAEGLTLTQWQVLLSLHFGRGPTGAALARDLAHDKGAMTRIIDALAERGWLTRERDSGDRRAVRLALTPEGQAVMERGRERVLACWNGWLAGMPEADVGTLIATLQRLRRAVEASPERCA